MPEIDAPYAPGTPCWLDLMATDQQAAMDHYGELFGWTGRKGPEEYGGYAIMEKNGRPVCGIGPRTAPEGAPEPPHVWTTYLATDDADATLRRVTESGGTALTGVMDVGDLGRMAVVADPTGAVFGIWQHREFIGAALVNEPGALLWNSCETRDTKAAAEFYRAALDLEAKPVPGMEGGLGLHLPGSDRPVGSIGEMGDSYPAEVPPFWLVCFAVHGLDEVIETHTRRGGTVVQPPRETPYGRVAGLSDAWGGVFSVMETAEG